VQILNKGQL